MKSILVAIFMMAICLSSFAKDEGDLYLEGKISNVKLDNKNVYFTLTGVVKYKNKNEWSLENVEGIVVTSAHWTIFCIPKGKGPFKKDSFSAVHECLQKKQEYYIKGYQPIIQKQKSGQLRSIHFTSIIHLYSVDFFNGGVLTNKSNRPAPPPADF